jgi:hypothetical protein
MFVAARFSILPIQGIIAAIDLKLTSATNHALKLKCTMNYEFSRLFYHKIFIVVSTTDTEGLACPGDSELMK